MQRYNSYEDLVQAHSDFEINMDHQLTYVVSNHTAVASDAPDGHYVACLIETCVSDYDGTTVLEVRTLTADQPGALETVSWTLREYIKPALAQSNSVFHGCFNADDLPGDYESMITGHFYLYCDTVHEAHQLLCDITSPAHNMNFATVS